MRVAVRSVVKRQEGVKRGERIYEIDGTCFCQGLYLLLEWHFRPVATRLANHCSRGPAQLWQIRSTWLVHTSFLPRSRVRFA